MNVLSVLEQELGAELATERQSLPQAVYYEPAASHRLAEALREHCAGRRAVVWFDVRTREAAGGPCVAALEAAGWTVLERCIADGPDGQSPVCDDVTMERLRTDAPDADAYVAVGSGVVNDLTKWLATEAGVPYAVLATAASMNGYAAANVAPAIGGVKSLFRARAPRVIAAIPTVIENAPFVLTAAGLGDVIAKPASTADWLLNHHLFGEAFHEPVTRLLERVERQYLDQPAALTARSPGAVEALFDALVLSGCAMTLLGSSLPASGGEHLISHTLDMMSHLDGQPHDLHGRQVGVASIFVSALYERVLDLDEPPWGAEQVPFEPAVWGRIASAVQTEHAVKAERMAAASRRLTEPGCWRTVRQALSPVLRAPAAIQRCLQAAGAAWRLADIGCSRERFLLAVRHCGAIRGRFTSIDLAHAAGVLPAAAEPIIDEWLC